MSLCRKITDWYICIMLLLFPVFTGFKGYSALTNSKFYFLLALSLAWLLAVIVLSLCTKSAPSNQVLKKTDILFLGVFVLISILSAVFSPWFPDTLPGAGRWDGLVSTLLYAAIYLGIRCFGEMKRHHLWCLGISTLLCTAVSIGQLLGGNPLRLFPGTLRYFDANIRYSGEFLGTIGNVDILAAYLCLCVPLFAFAYVGDRKNYPALLPAAAGTFLLLESGVMSGLIGLAVCVLAAAPLLLTSRMKIIRALQTAAILLAVSALSALLCFEKDGLHCAFSPAVTVLMVCAAICFFLAVLIRQRIDLPEKSKSFYGRIFLAVVVCVIIGGLIFLWIYPGKSGTLYELSRILHGELREEFGSSRIRIWRETLSLVRERPVLGGGTGSIAKRLSIHFSRLVPETGSTLQSFVDNAHNIYLTILSDTGVLGLLAYLGLLTAVFIHWLKNREDALSGALGCAVIAYSAEEFFGLGLCISAPIFWIFLPLCTVKMKSRPDAPEEFSHPEVQV